MGFYNSCFKDRAFKAHKLKGKQEKTKLLVQAYYFVL